MSQKSLRTGSFLVLLCVVTPASVWAAKPTALESVIRQISQKQKETTTLEADFRQEREIALLSLPEVSFGKLLFAKPNKVLWSYDSPRPVVMLIADGWMTTYYPQLNRAEKLEVKNFEDRIFKYMGGVGAMEDLAKYFDFTFVESRKGPYYTLELKPKTKTIAGRVQKIKIWIDRQTLFTSKFEYVEGDGDITRYEFTNIKVNQPIPAARFKLTLPATVKTEQMRIN